MRSTSEYVRSPQQQSSKYLKEWERLKKTNEHENSAKAFFQKVEAQNFAQLFRERIEQAIDEELDDLTVTQSTGDFLRKGKAKVHVGDDRFIHIFALRPSKDEPWSCRFS